MAFSGRVVFADQRMPITALTHVVGADRAHCDRCGRLIPAPVGIYHFNPFGKDDPTTLVEHAHRESPPDRYKFPTGKKIGVITFAFNDRLSESSYLTGANDSNSLCGLAD